MKMYFTNYAAVNSFRLTSIFLFLKPILEKLLEKICSKNWWWHIFTMPESVNFIHLLTLMLLHWKCWVWMEQQQQLWEEGASS